MSGNAYSISEVQNFLGQIYGQSVPDGKGGSRWVVPGLTVYPYAYSSVFLALAQNATQTNILQISANADFICFGISHRAQIGAAQTISSKTAPFCRLLITDSGTNEQFTSQAVDLENYSTNGGDYRPLQYPRFIGGKSSLTMQLTNYAPTAETYTSVEIMLSGVLARVRS
jgi:hypothetical protein